MDMNALSSTQVIVIIAIVVIAIAAIATVIIRRKNRSAGLRTKFGDPEYARVVHETGNQGRAEAKLDARTERVEGFRIRALGPGDRARFLESWRKLQARFVDSPTGAVIEADQLVGDLMSTRGYPVNDFEQQAADLSVDHPLVIENYRAAHEIAVLQATGKASTEQLRQAMIHYRTLFEDLAGEPEIAMAKTAS